MIPAALEQVIAHVAIRTYAAHSYLYYKKDTNIITDTEYDALCVWLAENYEWIKFYDMNDYLDLGQLICGSGFVTAEKVCGQTRDYAESLIAEPSSQQKKV